MLAYILTARIPCGLPWRLHFSHWLMCDTQRLPSKWQTMTGGPPHSKRCTAAWFSHLRGAATCRYTRVVVCPYSKNILPFPVAAALESSFSRLACKLLIKCDLLIRANNSEIFHFPTPIVWVESPVEVELAHESLFSGLVAPPPHLCCTFSIAGRDCATCFVQG